MRAWYLKIRPVSARYSIWYGYSSIPNFTVSTPLRNTRAQCGEKTPYPIVTWPHRPLFFFSPTCLWGFLLTVHNHAYLYLPPQLSTSQNCSKKINPDCNLKWLASRHALLLFASNLSIAGSWGSITHPLASLCPEQMHIPALTSLRFCAVVA